MPLCNKVPAFINWLLERVRFHWRTAASRTLSVTLKHRKIPRAPEACPLRVIPVPREVVTRGLGGCLQPASLFGSSHVISAHLPEIALALALPFLLPAGCSFLLPSFAGAARVAPHRTATPCGCRSAQGSGRRWVGGSEEAFCDDQGLTSQKLHKHLKPISVAMCWTEGTSERT